MTRKTLLTITAITAATVGCLALFGPAVLLGKIKVATPSPAANTMARTAGVLLIAIGLLNFLVRHHGDTPTMRAILIVNLVLQLGILPIDPLAYATGAFTTLGSFVPNTILHLLLAAGFIHQLRIFRRAAPHRPR